MSHQERSRHASATLAQRVAALRVAAQAERENPFERARLHIENGEAIDLAADTLATCRKTGVASDYEGAAKALETLLPTI